MSNEGSDDKNAKIATPTLEPPSEDRRQYFNFLQGVIDRMARNSSALKQWLIPTLVLVYGVASQRANLQENLNYILSGLSITVIVVFWLLDAYYLMLERGYRKLFRKAVKNKIKLYRMKPLKSSQTCRDYLKAIFTTSTCPFYCALIVLCTIISFL